MYKVPLGSIFETGPPDKKDCSRVHLAGQQVQPDREGMVGSNANIRDSKQSNSFTGQINPSRRASVSLVSNEISRQKEKNPLRSTFGSSICLKLTGCNKRTSGIPNGEIPIP